MKSINFINSKYQEKAVFVDDVKNDNIDPKEKRKKIIDELDKSFFKIKLYTLEAIFNSFLQPSIDKFDLIFC